MKSSILFFSALAAAAPLHDHNLEVRDYVYKTNWHTTTTTIYTTIWVNPGQPTPTAEAQAASTKYQGNMFYEVKQNQPSSSSTAVVPTVVQPTVVENQALPTAQTQETATSSTSVYTPPAAFPSASALYQTGGGTGPTGETHSGVRLSPMLNYNTVPGSSLHNWGACGNAPNYDKDPLWYENDDVNDMKVMLDPPGGDIMKYCAAIIKVTNGNGKSTTVTVVDSCADCGGEGGMDMMKAPWKEVGGADDSPVLGASWTIIGWAEKEPIPQ